MAKRRREAGQEYEARNKVVRRAKEVKTLKDCGLCRYKCKSIISDQERTEINHQFWSLDAVGKDHFLDINTIEIEKASKRTKSTTSRRSKTMLYFFHLGGRKVRVCKEFFCGTLDISHQKVKYFQKVRKDKDSGCIKQRQWGKNVKKIVSNDAKDSVREHIKLLPKVESHYCRSSTSREYLEANLSLAKLYDMYSIWCREQGKSPVKKHMYVTIFNTDFNIAFVKPKKDRCDLCEKFRLSASENNLTDEEKHIYETHRASVQSSREEKQKDKDKADVILSFDLENVLTLPKADVSNFCYRRKLSCYNLTGYLSVDKSAFCCIWTEALCGRKGNDIASAVVKILKNIVQQHSHIQHLTLWSDSCVPQNKNSIMSLALKKFLEENPTVKSITQKYSEKGHSCVQEVDAIHSCIEKALSPCEVFSPLGLVKVLTNLRRKGKVVVIQMRKEDFFDYQTSAKSLNFCSVPYTKVKQLLYSHDASFHLTYKLCHQGKETTVSIRNNKRTRNTVNEALPVSLPNIRLQAFGEKTLISKEKEKDLKVMLEYMPALDKAFMKSHCKL